ncbi:hypothetical protein QBC46DRAFT_364385 [Diplogelasinospora grovesii]|uniref:Uncharacterized protein n=1 Tax=Diplogelasinospora grovesii TaxID=303347 RepID=A0AAN6N6I0_9PEZI|nr:hypothetical protein QBC46DRAFT_364385 [Diplogelasinospora grovesii]
MGNSGRGYLAMQVLLRFYKGHNKEIKLPLLCPISKLLAKAISEGVVDLSGYDTCAEPYSDTKLSIPAVYIPWKKEFWHKPVFRKTIESVEGPEKSDEPLSASAFDNNSENLRKAGGFLGNLEILDRRENYRQSIRDQGTRYRPNSTVYQRYYTNAMRNAMSQDASLGRGTESPYLDILNHLGLQYDENALTGVSDETMRMIGPDSTIRRLEIEWSALKAMYATSQATGADGKMLKKKCNELSAARQRRRRKVADLLRKDYFKQRNNKELDRQHRGRPLSRPGLQA